jgi:hypothetical protein
VPTIQLARPRVRETPFVVQKITPTAVQKTWRVHRTTTFQTGRREMPFVSTDLKEVVVGPDLIILLATLGDQTSASPFVDRQNSIVATTTFVVRQE